MKSMFTFKQAMWFIFGILAICALSVVAIFATIKYAASGGEWVASTINMIGSVLGGIIGGFVAYFVASYQVKATLSNERKKQLQMSNTVLALIIEELHKNMSVAKEIVPYKPEYEGLVTTLADQVWQSSFRYLAIPSELLIKINACYNLINLGKSTKAINEELLNKISDNIALTLEAISIYNSEQS